jgi:Domain of unknown function (DUF4124)
MISGATFPIIRVLGIVALSLMSSAIAAADTYRWRDADGALHFGDKPPANVRAEKITVRAQPSRLTSEEAKQEVQRLREVEATRSADKAAAKAANKAAATAAAPELAAKRERCERAQWALSALEEQRPVYRDEQGMYRIKRPPGQADVYTGERAYLDDAARAKEIAKQQQLIAVNCGAQPSPEDKARTAEEIRLAEHCEAAAADLELLIRNNDRDRDRIASRQKFLQEHCTPPASVRVGTQRRLG